MLPYFMLHTSNHADFKPLSTTLTDRHTHLSLEAGRQGHATTAAPETKKAPMTFRKIKRIVGELFWLVGHMPQRRVKKGKYATTAMSLPPQTGWRENSHLSSGEPRRRKALSDTERLTSDSAASECKHSHTELLPAAGTPAPASSLHFSKWWCGFLTCRRNNPTQKSQASNRRDYFYGDN